MTGEENRPARLSLHLMASGWSAALLVTFTALIRLQLPFWLLLPAYLLPALLRRRSPALAVAAALLVAATAAFYLPLSDLFFAALVLLAQSARALTLSRHPGVTFLRVEQRRGLALVLLAVLGRAMLGRPDIMVLALFALIYLVGALGLPLALSREAGDRAAERARPGLRVGLLIGGVSAAIALVIGALHYAAMHRAFAFFGPLFTQVFKLVAYVIGYVLEFVLGLVAGQGHYRHFQLPKHPKSGAHHPGQPLLHGAHHPSLWLAAIILGAIVLLLAFLLYRRQTLREAPEGLDPNALQPGEDLARQRLRPERRRQDFGAGARRLVRRTVGLHVRGEDLPPGTTARAYARQEGWEAEWLQTYEHARYGFVEPFPEDKARAFVAAFLHRFRRRAARRRDPGDRQ